MCASLAAFSQGSMEGRGCSDTIVTSVPFPQPVGTNCAAVQVLLPSTQEWEELFLPPEQCWGEN